MAKPKASKSETPATETAPPATLEPATYAGVPLPVEPIVLDATSPIVHDGLDADAKAQLVDVFHTEGSTGELHHPEAAGGEVSTPLDVTSGEEFVLDEATRLELEGLAAKHRVPFDEVRFAFDDIRRKFVEDGADAAASTALDILRDLSKHRGVELSDRDVAALAAQMQSNFDELDAEAKAKLDELGAIVRIPGSTRCRVHTGTYRDDRLYVVGDEVFVPDHELELLAHCLSPIE